MQQHRQFNKARDQVLVLEGISNCSLIETIVYLFFYLWLNYLIIFCH